MNYTEIINNRNKLLAEKVIKGLKSRNMAGYYVDTKEEALKKALELIPEGSSVSWGGSVSTQTIGLNDAIKSGNYKAIDRSLAKTPEESTQIMKEGLFADYFLMSTNAITEDGILFNIDGNANRVAALCFGPDHVLMIVGMNKVVSNLDEAILRARHTAAPINACRFKGDSPCRKTGACADCLSKDTICCQLVETRFSRVPDRIQVILVGEELGF